MAAPDCSTYALFYLTITIHFSDLRASHGSSGNCCSSCRKAHEALAEALQRES